MRARKLGHMHWELPIIGLGCMGLSEFYGPPLEHNAAIKLLHEAIDLGVVHFDTAEIYGIGSANETLLGEAFADRRDQVFIATKFGLMRNGETGEFMGLDGSAQNCRRAIEGSLRRLRTDHIDLYYLHRVDPTLLISARGRICHLCRKPLEPRPLHGLVRSAAPGMVVSMMRHEQVMLHTIPRAPLTPQRSWPTGWRRRWLGKPSAASAIPPLKRAHGPCRTAWVY